MKDIEYKPRGDYVVVEILDTGKMKGGLIAPQSSVHGKQFLVRAVGPGVIGLKVDDMVFPIGRKGQEYFDIPNTDNLILVKQDNIPLILEKKN